MVSVSPRRSGWRRTAERLPNSQCRPRGRLHQRRRSSAFAGQFLTAAHTPPTARTRIPPPTYARRCPRSPIDPRRNRSLCSLWHSPPAAIQHVARRADPLPFALCFLCRWLRRCSLSLVSAPTPTPARRRGRRRAANNMGLIVAFCCREEWRRSQHDICCCCWPQCE